jgi:hypothetical protein
VGDHSSFDPELGGGGGGSAHVPIPYSQAIDTSAGESILKKIAANDIIVPSSINDLFNEDVFTSQLSINVATQLKIPFGASDNSLSRKIFIQEYAKFKDINVDEKYVRWGVSIRWIINIKIINTSAEISSLPMVAAAAQVGYINATARFQVVGLNSSKITSLIPAPAELNIETYMEMKNAFSSIKALIHDSSTSVKPQILSVLAEVPEEDENKFDEAIAITWALLCFKKGKSMTDSFINKKSKSFNDVVKTTYTMLMNNKNLQSTASGLLEDVKL